MLARTHGQPASPTRLGKEFMVFAEHIENQVDSLSIFLSVQNLAEPPVISMHICCVSKNDWIKFGNDFVNKPWFNRQQYTTQIEHYDMLAAHFDP